MARCRQCGLKLSRLEEHCPRCGASNPANLLKPWFTGLALVRFLISVGIILLVVVAVGNSPFWHRFSLQQRSATFSPPTGTIAGDTGQWAIQLDTLKFDRTGKGSAMVCHQGEYGSSCNKWTFNCSYLREFAHSDYIPPIIIEGPNNRSLTERSAGSAELDVLDAVATKLPATACQLR